MRRLIGALAVSPVPGGVINRARLNTRRTDRTRTASLHTIAITRSSMLSALPQLREGVARRGRDETPGLDEPEASTGTPR
jgi:hypothetical protein